MAHCSHSWSYKKGTTVFKSTFDILFGACWWPNKRNSLKGYKQNPKLTHCHFGRCFLALPQYEVDLLRAVPAVHVQWEESLIHAAETAASCRIPGVAHLDGERLLVSWNSQPFATFLHWRRSISLGTARELHHACEKWRRTGNRQINSVLSTVINPDWVSLSRVSKTDNNQLVESCEIIAMFW